MKEGIRTLLYDIDYTPAGGAVATCTQVYIIHGTAPTATQGYSVETRCMHRGFIYTSPTTGPFRPPVAGGSAPCGHSPGGAARGRACMYGVVSPKNSAEKS